MNQIINVFEMQPKKVRSLLFKLLKNDINVFLDFNNSKTTIKQLKEIFEHLNKSFSIDFLKSHVVIVNANSETIKQLDVLKELNKIDNL